MPIYQIVGEAVSLEEGVNIKIQENVIYESVKAESNADIAHEVVYGKEWLANVENNSDWVRSIMHRLENQFDCNTVKKIRINCQCGYGMDEKLALVKELMSTATNIKEFARADFTAILAQRVLRWNKQKL